MTIGIAVMIAVCLVVALVVVLKWRGKPADAADQAPAGSAKSAGTDPSLAGSTVPARSAAPAQAPAAPPAVKAPVALQLPDVAAPTGSYQRVSCSTQNGVHGAMPPFGTLSCTDGVLVFEATSRVVTKASAVGGDGSATLQSLGAVERGNYRFEITMDTVQRIDMKGSTAAVHCDAGLFEFEALGNAGPNLRAWLVAQGLEIA